jgi:hypothetical protein
MYLSPTSSISQCQVPLNAYSLRPNKTYFFEMNLDKHLSIFILKTMVFFRLEEVSAYVYKSDCECANVCVNKKEPLDCMHAIVFRVMRKYFDTGVCPPASVQKWLPTPPRPLLSRKKSPYSISPSPSLGLSLAPAGSSRAPHHHRFLLPPPKPTTPLPPQFARSLPERS